MKKQLIELYNAANKEDREFIIECCDRFTIYVQAVVDEFKNSLSAMSLTGEERRDFIAKNDRDRRNAHESAITSCNVLNRFCDLYKLPRIFKEEALKDREKVAEICKSFVDEMWMSNSYRNENFDDFVEEVAKNKIKFLNLEGIFA